MNELILELYQTNDYNTRLGLIEKNLKRIDDTFVEFFEKLIAGIDEPQAKLALATFRATMLAEVTFVQAKKADVRTARRFAVHCLRAYQEGFRLFGELAGDHGKRTRNCLEALLADTGEFRKLGLEEEGWQAYWLADPISAAIETAEQPRDIEAGKLLAAAWTLERAGMRDRAAAARDQAREKLGDEHAFKKEMAWTKKLAGALPEGLPPPDIYEGTSIPATSPGSRPRPGRSGWPGRRPASSCSRTRRMRESFALTVWSYVPSAAIVPGWPGSSSWRPIL